MLTSMRSGAVPLGPSDRVRRTTRHASAAPFRLGSIVARGPRSGAGDGFGEPCRPAPAHRYTAPSAGALLEGRIGRGISFPSEVDRGATERRGAADARGGAARERMRGRAHRERSVPFTQGVLDHRTGTGLGA